MLEVKDVSICIHTRYLVENLSFTLNKGDKLAIIGEEGNGKSTLLKCLVGNCDYADITGRIVKKGTIGYLEQSMHQGFLQMKVSEFLFSNQTNYHYPLSNLYLYLEQLQLQDCILEQKIGTLSGGEKIKIQILKLLLEDYDILLLDEPTNDLDIETLEWLEIFLNKIDKPILYISHDEVLLSNTANRILHIEQLKHKKECKHTILNVDYESYIKTRFHFLQKQTQLAGFEKREFQKKQEKLKQIMQKVEYQQNTITRADPHGGKVLKKKMHALKSFEKKLVQTELTEIPDVEEEIQFFFGKVSIPHNKVILKLEQEELIIGNRVLTVPIRLEVKGSEHICIIGRNGIGKTTLLKNIYEILKDRIDVQIGYMPQYYEDSLEDSKSVLEFLQEVEFDLTKIRMYLGNMKFTKEEMMGKIGNLSNGTKAKLFLIKFVLGKCNVLVLDEPTRNVSPLSNPVIRSILKAFEGTIISVSHDRKYIDEVADIVYELTEVGLREVKR